MAREGITYFGIGLGQLPQPVIGSGDGRPDGMRRPRHRRGRLHRHLRRRAAAGAATTVLGIDDLNSYYDPSLKAARLARLTGRDGFTFRRARSCRTGRRWRRSFGEQRVRPGDPPGRPGGGPLLAREPGGVRRQQPGRLPDDPRGLPPRTDAAPRLRLDQLGLRRQHAGSPSRRTTASTTRSASTPRPSGRTS